jgi:phage terminase large subunit-like protein
VPRKAGKSTLGAGFGLYLTFADGENFAEVISAAGTRSQAGKVFDEARRMVEGSPDLKSRSRVFLKCIVNTRDGGNYQVISADADFQHGGNLSGIIFDELHVQKNRDLWDVLATSTGSRDQPLTIAITTAGYDRESICWKIHERAMQVIDNPSHDESFYAVIYAADEEDDWTDPEIWKKANPTLGVTPKMESLEKLFNIAKDSPPDQNTFRRLHLNQWTEQETRMIEMSIWDECSGKVDADALKGRRCYGGLDLASTSDLAAFLMVFPPEDEDGLYRLLPRFWIPGNNIVKRGLKDQVAYDGWVRAGLLNTTPGNTIDFDYIRYEINELNKDYYIKEIAYDSWGAALLSSQLLDDGFEMYEFIQGWKSYAAPTKEFLALLLNRRLAHGNNPILRWMASNMVAKIDPAGNMKPDKSKARQKIDGIVAAIMGVDRAMRKFGYAGAGRILTL